MTACPILVPASPAAAEPISDLDLARRVAANDGAAFIVLMRRYNRVLYRAARAQRTEAHRILQGRIDALPAALRSVFVLRAVEDLSVDEVAAALDIPKAIVRVRFFRAKRLLRTALASQSEVSLASLLPFAGARCNGTVDAVLARRP